MMSRRKLHACGIIIAALSCVPAFAANSWSQFRDPDGAFTVDFPGRARESDGVVSRHEEMAATAVYWLLLTAGYF